jgi:hypothetical protein
MYMAFGIERGPLAVSFVFEYINEMKEGTEKKVPSFFLGGQDEVQRSAVFLFVSVSRVICF